MKKTDVVNQKIVKIVQGSVQDRLLSNIRAIWETAQVRAAHSINTEHVKAGWLIGRQIVEAQQSGRRRAGYGERLLSFLSEHLCREFGTGFSVSSLKYMRLFYIAYPDLIPIRHPPGDESGKPGNGHPLGDEFSNPGSWMPGNLHPALSWRHYRALLKVDRMDARNFYEIEAIRSCWSGRQLERQIDSLLFYRLAKSRDKKGLLALANKGHQILKPVDAVKDPYVLEFLNVSESHALVESKLEQVILSRLQEFLLELGRGFAFVGRQCRITLEGDHFYPDLVFYHTRLKCYLIIELKTGKLTHGDLGQMLLYVNYYDREVTGKGDNPTLGLMLCTDKNDALAKFVLDDKYRRIFTSRYQLHLPTEKELQTELKRELELLVLPEPIKVMKRSKR